MAIDYSIGIKDMMRIFFSVFFALFLLASCGQADKGAKSGGASGDFERATKGLTHKPGFFDLYTGSNQVLAVLPAGDEEGLVLSMIYATGLTSGLGSNPIGLDRGAFDSGVILNFRRAGDKLIAEQENTRYRATADRPLEKKAVKESFARSFLWSGSILAETEDGKLLVDLSDFLTRDHFGVVKSIADNPAGGNYAVAGDRSFPDTEAAFAFPDNVELDAFLTLSSKGPGRETRATAADARDVTLVQHHSFIRLPAPGFKTRTADQRAGSINISYYDFSSPLDEPIVTELARRFRLERVDPAAASGPVKKPIIYYVDSGAPQQIQDALIEGAMWWADAFEAAGFEDAYRVEILPEGAHPFDVRYNMIQWTHRQTRGWSYGGGVSDPRTGEMLKASVILGSQRVRQDRMIFEGLAGADKTGSGAADDPVEIALARIRQLSAHEVGHTLGFAHNFAASANDRASVMDYPAPDIRARRNGTLDFSKAYAVGIGDWDIFTTKWLYTEFAETADEAEGLGEIIEDAYGKQGLRYIADGEARSVGTAHPYGSVWDNGEDAAKALRDTLKVREIALENFGSRSLSEGRPVSDLNAVIVPIYLYHRYQVAAAAKSVGGLDYTYALKGDDNSTVKPVSRATQVRALEALLATLDPAALDLSDRVLNQLLPQINSGFGGGETFRGRTGPVFDLLSAADVSADLTMSAILHPQRAARLVAFNRRDPNALSLEEVIEAIEEASFAPVEAPRHEAIANTVQARFAKALMSLSTHPDASSAVRAITESKLYELNARLSGAGNDHAAWLGGRIEAHLGRGRDEEGAIQARTPTPPGSPIGSAIFTDGPAYETCWHCE